ncbi:hypothetical protein EON65_01215 [archaeon]|nr:MAG: hypothetical protein EON65_01215 [archaeon]
MSFEQRKRVSIAIELAANPSILFLDEPTTGLDSRAAQAVIRNIRRIASSGRTVVCTIHQPSASIFFSFDSLLLLKKGGETVYFGDLGVQCKNLVSFFQAAPHVSSITHSANPATWMLEVIGAGTSSLNQNETDFRAYYQSSALCEANMSHLHALMRPIEGSRKVDEDDPKFSVRYNASYWSQFTILLHRWHLSYWRTPTYTISRHITMILIALIFASAYPQQKYDDYIGDVSRAMVIYITNFFCGILALLMATPVAASERPVFYKEQHSKMYSVLVYATTMILIEIPYLITSSLAFTLPFFYIVGFDNVGDVTAKFFWFWLFNFFFQATMLYLAQFFVAVTPDEASAQVLGGLFNTVLGLFCGILIPEQSYPPFWLFMYWLNPLHYCLEALFMTQFHGDTTEITGPDGSITTAQAFIEDVAFEKWSYEHLWYDILALCLFIGLSM